MASLMWFTADPHFAHVNIIRFCNRPFADVGVMNAALIDAWNERIAPADEVFVLGDLALGQTHLSVPPLKRLHGRKYLVPGNHDRCWPAQRGGPRHLESYVEAGFEICDTQLDFSLAGRDVVLCHFPYRVTTYEGDRYATHRPVDEGKWLLHGHIHTSWKVRDRMINVGVDVWDYAPVHGDELTAPHRRGGAEGGGDRGRGATGTWEYLMKSSALRGVCRSAYGVDHIRSPTGIAHD